MKTFTYSLLFCFLLVSCSPESSSVADESPTADFQIDIEGTNTGRASTILMQTELMAGQHIHVGYITVSSENGIITVTYTTHGDWQIDATHLFVGDLDDLPTNRGGNPKIGKFPHKDDHPNGTTTVTYTDIATPAGDCFVVASHAVVSNTITNQNETAWGNGDPTGGNSWAMYSNVCNPSGPSY